MENDKLVPDLRFGEFAEEWEKQSLSDLLDFKNGINAGKEAYGRGYKFINVLDIINNNFITHDDIIGSVEVSEKDFNKNIVEYGDILFQRSSETREEVGQSSVYLDPNQPATFGGFVIRGKKIGDYDPAFLNFLLKTAQARKEITSKSGGSTRYNVGQATLSEVVILAPTEAEQKKIAHFLTQTDQSLQLLQDKKSNLEAYKKGVMQRLFSQELRFKEENGADFPAWEEKRLGEICKVNPKSLKLPSNFLYIDLESVQNGNLVKFEKINLSEAPSRAQRLLKKNDILYQTVRPYQKNNYFFKDELVAVASTGYAQLRVKQNPSYLFHYLHYQKFVNKVIKRCTGTSYPAINSSDLAKIYVELPCQREQQKIANFLTQIDQKIEKTAAQIEQMQGFKQGLLQQMFI